MRRLIFCFFIFLSPAWSVIASAQTSAHCVTFNTEAEIIKNKCDYEIEAFVCDKSCSGNRYYRWWVNLQAGAAEKFQTDDISDVRYGACPGTYFTAEHSASAAYTCINPIPDEISDGSEISTDQGTAALFDGHEAEVNFNDVEAVWGCSSFTSVKYSARRVGSHSLRIRSQAGSTLTLNAFNSSHPSTGEPWIDPVNVHKFLCESEKDKTPAELVRESFYNVLLKARDKFDQGQDRSSPCLCVRG